VAKEVARNVLPVGTYTAFYATCNPRSLMHFLSLRTQSDTAQFASFPQYEIEQVAREMEAAFAERFPLTYTTFVDNGRAAP
jgi:thymidylate synthase (FAD)